MELRRRESWTVALNGASVALAALGTIAAFLIPLMPELTGIPLVLWAAGVTALAAAAAFGFDVATLSHILQDQIGGTRYERLRRANRLRTATILLRLLQLLAVLMLAGYLLLRYDVVAGDLSVTTSRRATALVLLALIGLSAYTHHQALRVPLERDLGDLRRVMTYVALAGGAIATIAAAYLLNQAGWAIVDAGAVSVAGHAAVSLALAAARGLPGLVDSMADPGRISAGGYSPGKKANLAPALVAFTILGFFALLLIVLSAGLTQVLRQAGESRLLLGILLAMGISVAVGLFFSLRLSQQTDRPTLYKEATPREARDEAIVLGLSIPVAAACLVVAGLLQQGGSIGPVASKAWIHFAGLALLIGLGPFGFYKSAQANRTRRLEERFPDLLRDLASSHKGGLTLAAAVQVAARGDYGSLSPEVEKMADQLTWGISFQECLARLAERVPTPLIRRTVSLIREATSSGGNTADVLMAAARDARELKTLERQRRLNMGVYTLVIYVTFFVFLFVVGVLYDRFVPEILAATEATQNSGLDGVAALQLGGISLTEYQTFYFVAGMVQAIGNGVLAGVMGSGKALLGLRHAFWMVAFTYITFGFILV